MQIIPVPGPLTSGTDGALDALYVGGYTDSNGTAWYNALAAGDVALVVYDGMLYVYQFATGSSAYTESSPRIIVPDNQSAGVSYTGYGAWILISMTMAGLAAGDISSGVLNKIIHKNPGSMADHEWQGTAEPGTAGEALARGDLLYKKYNSSAWKWYKYDADATDKLILPDGIATADIASGSAGVVMTSGIMRDDTWALTATADAAVTVYASTTAGGLTLTAPSATGNEIVVIGHLCAGNTIRFRPGYAWAER